MLDLFASPTGATAAVAMTPDGFIAKWRASGLKESSAAQEHFIDLCRLLADMFTRMLEQARGRPARFAEMAGILFGAMANRGGLVGFEPVAWFNGGLFDDDTALPLERDEIDTALRAAALDWSEIDPSILGTRRLARSRGSRSE